MLYNPMVLGSNPVLGTLRKVSENHISGQTHAMREIGQSVRYLRKHKIELSQAYISLIKLLPDCSFDVELPYL